MFKEQASDLPKYPCFSCDKLCFMRNVHNLEQYEKNINDKKIWMDLKNLVSESERQWICKYCYLKITNDTMPSTCILNKMFSDPIPPEINCLNEFEKLLMQRAKCFQKITSTKTVMNINLPFKGQMKKASGTAYHLPLPIEETFKKLCKETDIINLNHELYIIDL